MYIIKAC